MEETSLLWVWELNFSSVEGFQTCIMGERSEDNKFNEAGTYKNLKAMCLIARASELSLCVPPDFGSLTKKIASI
jgi:hypothetical protein